MSSTSMNGWPASPSLPTRPLIVNGVAFHIADNDDVETVFTYLITLYAMRVEPLKVGQCACFSYRPNRNNPNVLSNHSSATAIDLDWEGHPNGTPTSRTFTADQIAACHQILASVPELADLVHWGGDWGPPLTTDSMHWELHSHDLALLGRVAARILALGDDMPAPKDWDAADWAAFNEHAGPGIAAALLNASIDQPGDTVKKALRLAAGLPNKAAGK